jgi:hypothetical protein
VVARGLLLASLLFGCTRGYDDIPEGPDPLDFERVEAGHYVYNPRVFRGNEESGVEFELTTCPVDEVLVGLDVYLHPLTVKVDTYPAFPVDVPIAMTMRCATWGQAGEVGKPDLTKQLHIGDIDAADITNVVHMDCPEGSVVTTLRGGEEAWRLPRWISALGIECADSVAWRRVDGAVLADYTRQAGFSTVGTEHFADTCAKPLFALNGFFGRIGDRLEQISASCATTRLDWVLLPEENLQ